MRPRTRAGRLTGDPPSVRRNRRAGLQHLPGAELERLGVVHESSVGVGIQGVEEGTALLGSHASDRPQTGAPLLASIVSNAALREHPGVGRGSQSPENPESIDECVARDGHISPRASWKLRSMPCRRNGPRVGRALATASNAGPYRVRSQSLQVPREHGEIVREQEHAHQNQQHATRSAHPHHVPAYTREERHEIVDRQ